MFFSFYAPTLPTLQSVIIIFFFFVNVKPTSVSIITNYFNQGTFPFRKFLSN